MLPPTVRGKRIYGCAVHTLNVLYNVGVAIHASAPRSASVCGATIVFLLRWCFDRDCMNRNIMLDPVDLYPDSFHPVETMLNKDCSGYAKHFTRTQRRPKYHFIDFGLSRRYGPSDTNPREVPIWGGDKDVPEFQNSNEPCNPFPTDVFYIGNAIRKDFIMVSCLQQVICS